MISCDFWQKVFEINLIIFIVFKYLNLKRCFSRFIVFVFNYFYSSNVLLLTDF